VLADFVNTTGDAVFDDALKQAPAVDLGQSPFLNVLSDRKMSETLRLMGRAPGEPSDAGCGAGNLLADRKQGAVNRAGTACAA